MFDWVIGGLVLDCRPGCLRQRFRSRAQSRKDSLEIAVFSFRAMIFTTGAARAAPKLLGATPFGDEEPPSANRASLW